MGFRFFRRVRIMPGVSLNFSKSGGSLSVGPRGAKMTVGPRGVRRTVGIPGTGIHYTENSSTRQGSDRTARSIHVADAEYAECSPESRLSLGIFHRFFLHVEEKHFVDGLLSYIQGNESKALQHFSEAPSVADALFMAGCIRLKQEDFEGAASALERAVGKTDQLGRLFRKYRVDVDLTLPVAEEMLVYVRPDQKGLLLALVEAHQDLGDVNKALQSLVELRKIYPDHVDVKLSIAEFLYLAAKPADREAMEEILRLSADVENETPVHGALLLYKARALRRLGLHEPARDVLTRTLRRTKERGNDLLQALRYERAVVYELIGHKKRAQNDWEKLYAENPDYKDIKDRLAQYN